jgi:DNA-binding SARP family transcriptional activator/ABC-type branched-subunit amino acid transport system substrate-binding protein/DNA-binding beta-propeller fold protein YncE
MEFKLLGPFEVFDDGGRQIRVDAPKQRALLALLLLHREEVVSVDRLADELWAESAPPTATKTIQVYVAQLRKALGEGLVVTRGRGYSLATAGHDVDIVRFERLSSQGRGRLDGGDAAGAAELLLEALALWRGPPLADFAYEQFAQAEIGRLEEEHLAALEARIEADLALGRHDRLVPELFELTRRYPLRERLRAQLMLALYRSGRQAEALEAYRDVRRSLQDELGLEPGPALQELERAILAQDEAIEAPPRQLKQPRRGRPALLLFSGGLLVLAAAAALALELSRGGGGKISSLIAGSSLAAVDPRTGDVVAQIPVGATPTAVSVGEGAVWVLNADDQTISRIDPHTKDARTFGIGATPTDLVAGEGGMWVGNGGKLGRTQFAGATATAVTKLEPRTGSVRATIPLPRATGAVSNAALHHLALTERTVWAIAPDFSVARIDTRTNAVSARVRSVSAVAIASDGEQVWVLNDDGTVARIGTRTNRVTARIKVPATFLTALAVGDGSVWATDPYAGTLWRIDPGANTTQRTIDVGAGADSVAFGEGAVWVGNSVRGTLTRVDATSNRVLQTISIGNVPRAVAVGAGAVWVAVAGSEELPAAKQAVRGVRPLAGLFCSGVVSGEAAPRFLIASDLPLQGGPRFPTAQMSDAILYVLRRHRFRAGRYAVAYQSCDDSTAQTGIFDMAKCAANAKAYVANADVIGVLGPFNSGCAYAQIPVANRAGLAIVSPTNSDPGLTRALPGAPRGALEHLYPTGRRTYVRLLSPDDVQAAAGALLLRRLGSRRLFVVHDGGYGGGFAASFTTAAARLGLRVVGNAEWDPRRFEAGSLATRLAASGADGAYVCGLLDTNVATVLREVRKALPAAPVAGCDGLLPVSLLFEQTGPSARGVRVTVNGLIAERLPPAGRNFVRAFGATQPSGHVDVSAVYAAQATEVLLGAIARSDGTRTSVAKQVLATRIGRGLLGTVAFDANGDPASTPITVLRVEHGRGTNAVASYEGARFEAVITPPNRLFHGIG